MICTNQLVPTYTNYNHCAKDSKRFIRQKNHYESTILERSHFKKSGYYGNGTRRYHCLDCGKAFSPLTGTVFDAHKILIETFGLTEEEYTTKAMHNLPDDDNPMEPRNAVHGFRWTTR